MKSSTGQKAIITGATSGIGKALAILLVSKGYHVGITGRREANLLSIKDSYPKSVYVACFDISEADKVADHLNLLASDLGKIDLFVHCSGTGVRNADLNLQDELQTTRTNIDGFTASMNWAYKYFEKQGGGSLAAVSSIAGLRGFALSPSYSSSKSYQIKYLEALRQRSYNHAANISVTDIRAGFVDTAMGNGKGAFWQCSAETAANGIYKALTKGKDVAYITKRWVLVAWLMMIFPGFLFKRLKF